MFIMIFFHSQNQKYLISYKTILHIFKKFKTEIIVIHAFNTRIYHYEETPRLYFCYFSPIYCALEEYLFSENKNSSTFTPLKVKKLLNHPLFKPLVKMWSGFDSLAIYTGNTDIIHITHL